MKTVLIYDQCGQDTLQFLVLKGDHTYFDGVYINAADGDEKLQDKLSKVLFDESGNMRHKMRTRFPHKAVVKGARVVVCGFIP